MYFLKHIILTIWVAFIVTACGGAPDVHIDELIEEGELDDAIEWINDELEDMPGDALLNALAAEVKLRKCIKTNCFEKSPKLLKEFGAHLKHVGMRKIPTEEGERDLYGKLFNIISKDIILAPNHPIPLVALGENLPPNVPVERFSTLFLNTALKHIMHQEVPPARALLDVVIKMINNPNDPKVLTIRLVQSLISGDKEAVNKAASDIRKLPAKKFLNEKLISLIPHAVYLYNIENDPINGTGAFVYEFNNQIIALELPLLQETSAKTWMSNSMFTMAKDTRAIAKAKEHVIIENLDIAKPISKYFDDKIHLEENISNNEGTDVTPVKTPSVSSSLEKLSAGVTIEEILSLRIMKAGLIIDPSNISHWDTFLPIAMKYVDKSENSELLFSEISLDNIPTSAIDPYNAQLFKIINRKIEQGKDIINFTEKLIMLPETGEIIRKKAEKALKDAMDKAIADADYKAIYAYGTYNPEIAKLSRQSIVTLMINTLENKWKNNNFEGMEKIANFLNKEMEINFNLNNFLLKSLEEWLKDEGIVEKVSADTPEYLLKPAEEVRIQLGDKFEFIRASFADNPNTINAQLKSIVVNAKGVYGIPTALYVLFDLFNEDGFSTKDRNAYLISAIKNSISKDTSTAIEIAKRGQELQSKYTDIPLLFVVSEALKRLDGLEESRDLWDEVNDDFKTSLRNVKPQFAIMMEAIIAFEEGNKKTAAEKFSMISDNNYIKLATPYLAKITGSLDDLIGIYSIDNLGKGVNIIYLIIEKPPEKDPTTGRASTLLDLNVTLINAVGSTAIKSSDNLLENYGQLFRLTIPLSINPNNMEIEITDAARTNASLPKSFATIYGETSKLKVIDKTFIAEGVNGETYTFTKISDNPLKALFPEGRFGITRQISAPNANSDHVLPVGSILEFKTDTNNPIQPIKDGKKLPLIYKVSGTLRHPAAFEPLVVEGFYRFLKHDINLSYSYPLGDGGNLSASIRCQIANNKIICGGHNKNWTRSRYSHIVEGLKVMEKSAANKGNNEYKSLLPPPDIQ